MESCSAWFLTSTSPCSARAAALHALAQNKRGWPHALLPPLRPRRPRASRASCSARSESVHIAARRSHLLCSSSSYAARWDISVQPCSCREQSADNSSSTATVRTATLRTATLRRRRRRCRRTPTSPSPPALAPSILAHQTAFARPTFRRITATTRHAPSRRPRSPLEGP